MKKVLYFTSDFSAENVAFAQKNGLVMRNLLAYQPTDFVENCDAVCGDVPERYQHFPVYELGVKQENQTDKMTVDELKAKLTELGIEIPADAKKADLLALLVQKQ